MPLTISQSLRESSQMPLTHSVAHATLLLKHITLRCYRPCNYSQIFASKDAYKHLSVAKKRFPHHYYEAAISDSLLGHRST
jgi:hypothetical protein